MAKCPCCGQELNQNQIFCLNCMTKSIPQKEINPPKSKVKSIESNIVFRVIIVLVLIVAIVYMFFATKKMLEVVKEYNDVSSRVAQHQLKYNYNFLDKGE